MPGIKPDRRADDLQHMTLAVTAALSNVDGMDKAAFLAAGWYQAGPKQARAQAALAQLSAGHRQGQALAIKLLMIDLQLPRQGWHLARHGQTSQPLRDRLSQGSGGSRVTAAGRSASHRIPAAVRHTWLD